MNNSNREPSKALGQVIYKEQYLHQKDKTKDIGMKSALHSNLSASSSSTLYGRQLSINYTNQKECTGHNRQSYSTKPDYEIIGSEGYRAGNLSPDSLPQCPNNTGNVQNHNYLNSYAVGYELEGHGRMTDFSTKHTAKKMNTCRTRFLRQTSPLRNLQHCQDNSLKSESYLESRSGPLSSRQADVQQLSTSVANNGQNHSECYRSNSQLLEDGQENQGCSKTNRTTEWASRNEIQGTSFMLPTMSSERKNQQHLINSLSQLISPSRRAASVSPNSRASEMESFKEPVPYFEQAQMATEENISVHYEASQTEEQNTPHRKHLPPKKRNDETLNDLHKLRLNSSQNKNGVTTPNASSKELLIFQTMQRVKSEEWDVALNGLAEITELCQDIKPDAIYPHMTNINQKLLELLRSPRSHVTRTACQIAGRLFELMKDTRRPEFDDIVEMLLTKTADASKFIRNDANLSLDTMVTHIPIYHAVKSICLKGPHHKNPLVRNASIRLIICAVVIADPDVILHSQAHEHTRKRIIQFLPQFLSDRHLETRKYGERLYKIFSKDPDFDTHLKKYLEPKEVSRLNSIVKNERRKR
ncbi:uncharacterized protein LOC116164557 isoform X2 [Photinus pyralis]|uniref:uncharacterized protein LOC116164557 isoform X2 n=1 Tax=Photinus pyralis TaxID=7054 RepID=UPI0012676065|nr:uncharacterized protein LOC116164557 isoform X2 [Photinus pyralis]